MSGLVGMKAICNHMGQSETTVLKLIRQEGFPAVKVCGTWNSDSSEIEAWRKDKIRIARENNNQK
ncbi:hypothetical protein SAMN05660330_01421 [Desulforhopalus singaporensis]|uniref:Transcriptional regulator, AlpA family n=1 Tax=Desulforhopalus singaporensis TaxID=91360 RepID=A0A1H0NS29_9BACT|nr:hypothetical protein SAMN05660330_01421 [Desulforhopalus singaporensis]